MPDQNYATHRQYIPWFHFVALPILTINVIVALVQLFRFPGLGTGWQVVVAVALALVAFATRTFATKNQDRVIRLEERLRLERCLPAELKSRIGELSTSQLVALRFCSDAEAPDLVRAALSESAGREDIKKRIKSWRPDFERV